MFLKRADPLRGEVEGTFFGPEMQTSEASAILVPKNTK
jgi:hypothetical protein